MCLDWPSRSYFIVQPVRFHQRKCTGRFIYICCSSILTSGLFFSNQINFFEPVNFCKSVFNQLSEKGPLIFGVWIKKQGLGFLGGF